ncbi:MAG: carbohydrate kinase [Bifidobacteriaceae bacterium]|jgi:fructokinase|nr:carbohydrate kinase [Bifidobacteriaceae bacterium]
MHQTLTSTERVTTPERQALVVGEALIDLVPVDGTTRELPGGSPLNVAVALSRLGRAVQLATWLGPDARGQALQEHLAASGAVLVGKPAAPRTSTAQVSLDAHGQANYRFDLLWDFQPPPQIDNLAVVHTGSLATVIAPGAGKVTQFFQTLASLADAAPILTFDPNLRPALGGTAPETRAHVEELVAVADVVKASQEDLECLYPGQDPGKAARQWVDQGPALVVLTQAEQGALAFTRSMRINVPVRPATVADTVGAGDTFMAGLIDGLWQEGLIQVGGSAALQDLNEAQLLRALDRAARAAAVTVSRPGANPPWARELT